MPRKRENQLGEPLNIWKYSQFDDEEACHLWSTNLIFDEPHREGVWGFEVGNSIYQGIWRWLFRRTDEITHNTRIVLLEETHGWET